MSQMPRRNAPPLEMLEARRLMAASATAVAADIFDGNNLPHTVRVAYSATAGIDTSTLDNSDVVVTGPDGVGLRASFVSRSGTGDVTATYQVTPPGGTWDPRDSGRYKVALKGGQVKDLQGTALAAAAIGSFAVSVGAFTGSDNDVVADNSGRLFIAYHDNGDGALKLAVRGADGLWAAPQVIDSLPSGGRYVSLAINSAGQPAVAYFDQAGANLKYAEMRSGTWNVATIDRKGSTGQYPSLAFKRDGAPVISYFYKSGGDLRVATRMSKDRWRIGTVDGASTTTGRWSSIAVSPTDGRVMVAYDDSTRGELKLAHQVGDAWQLSVAASNKNGGGFASLAIDSAGVPGISYLSNDSSNLMFAQPVRGTWATRVIASPGPRGGYSHLHFAADNTARVTYFNDIANTLNVANRSTNGTWTLTPLIADGGRDARATYAPDGTMSLSWVDSSTGQLFVNTPTKMAPSNVAASVLQNGSVRLTWDATVVGRQYKVERRTGTGAWSTRTTTAANVATYTDTGVVAATTYEYRVSAVGNGPASKPSSAVQVTTPTPTTPTEPTTPTTPTEPTTPTTPTEPTTPTGPTTPVGDPGVYLSARLATAAGKVTANSAQWQAFLAHLDGHLDLVMSDLPEGNYQGSQLSWSAEYALGYRLLKDADPTRAAKYADKAASLLSSSLTSTQKGTWGGRRYIGSGDGATRSFTLPDDDVRAGTLRVYVVSTYTGPITRAAGVSYDQYGPYAHPIKISRTNGGGADYVQGVDWKVSADQRDGHIEWISSNRPAAGATYYVTSATASTTGPTNADGNYAFAGRTLTMNAPLAANQAIFAEYMHGRTGDADGGAYQESTDGRGGFNAVYYDNTFPGRYFGHLAMSANWLEGYAGFSSGLKSRLGAMLVRWSDYLRTDGYMNNSAESNYGLGNYASRVVIAANAVGLTDATTAERLKNEVVAWYAAHLDTTLKDESTGNGRNKGGHWNEGWTYGSGAIADLLTAVQTLDHMGWIDSTSAQVWAAECLRQIAAEMPTRTTIYDGGDNYSSPAPTPDGNMLTMLADTAQHDAVAAGVGRFLANGYSSGLIDLLYRDPSAALIDPATANLPLAKYASGTGFVAVRRDWSYDSTLLTFQSGNSVWADHQNFTSGQVTLNAGRDALLAQPDGIGQGHNTYKAYWGNTVLLDDGGAGKQIFRQNQAWTYGPVGNSVTHFETNADYSYTSGDYKNAYGNPNNQPYTTTATKLTRSVMYLTDSDYAVVYDRVETPVAGYQKQLQWWTVQAPTVSGDAWVAGAGHRTGNLYNDANNNQRQDANEPVVKMSLGVTLRGTDMNGNAVELSTTTDHTGRYAFDHLMPGNYTLTAQAGFGMSVNVADAADSKLFAQTYSNVPLTTVATTQRVGKGDFHRIALNPTTPTTSVRYVTAFQVKDVSTTTAASTSHVTSGDNKLDGTRVGNEVALFGRDGQVSGGSSYVVNAASGTTLTHHIADLTPGATYRLSGASAATATASAAGVLTFTTLGTGSNQTVSLTPN